MSDRTYCETQGEAPFDWWKALENPPLQDSQQHRALVTRSMNWVMCATGNQCAIIPRYEQGVPKDRVLSGLGCDFNDHIVDGEWGAAKDTLRQIEARSEILIAEELAKRNQQPA